MKTMNMDLIPPKKSYAYATLEKEKKKSKNLHTSTK